MSCGDGTCLETITSQLYTYISTLSNPLHISISLKPISDTLGSVYCTGALEQKTQHGKLTGTKQSKSHHDGVGAGLHDTVHDSESDIRPSQFRLCSHEAGGQCSRRSAGIQGQSQSHGVESSGCFMEMVVVVGC